MKETFAVPCVGAIIEKEINGEKHILIQEREKLEYYNQNGLLEFPAGKIREYSSGFHQS
ncbi:hypothetical protein [Miniphocaeibacter halophilus]|uniref:hypothetical protein n=1 Tax=Miniphocaeibacter halophilus TaxID=2931922 RepID=UPI001FB4334B|nr:hypothetical protein [Miniphocaeibacter halophilus]